MGIIAGLQEAVLIWGCAKKCLFAKIGPHTGHESQVEFNSLALILTLTLTSKHVARFAVKTCTNLVLKIFAKDLFAQS